MRWQNSSATLDLSRQWPEATVLNQRGRLSNIVPRSRTELSASGVKRMELDRDYIAVAPGRFIHSSHGFDADQLAYARRQHPSGLEYPAPIEIRTRGHWARHPAWVATSWSALRLYGMRWFCDHADACFITHATRQPPKIILQARRQRWAHQDGTQRGLTLKYKLDPVAPEMRVVLPGVAVASALDSVGRGAHSWWVPDVPGLVAKEVRVIQLADAVCRLWNMEPSTILPFIEDFVSKRLVTLIAQHSNAGSDSPAETCLRLALAGIAEGMVTQYQVVIDGRLISIADIPWPELKILVYYDGSHHGEPDQWEFDNSRNRALLRAGYIVLRYTRTDLRYLDRVLVEVEAAAR